MKSENVGSIWILNYNIYASFLNEVLWIIYDITIGIFNIFNLAETAKKANTLEIKRILKHFHEENTKILMIKSDMMNTIFMRDE